MDESQDVTNSQEMPDIACPHAEAVGKRWGDPISKEREAELEVWIVDQQGWATTQDRYIPFNQLRLTGADVFWLSKRAIGEYSKHFDSIVADKPPRESLYPLLKPYFALRILHLEGANLRGAHLEGANLSEACLEESELHGAHLEGADLSRAHLEGADLSEVTFDEDTELTDAILGPQAFRDWLDQLRSINRNAALVDIKWHGVNLATIPWKQVRRLGEERDAHNGMHESIERAYRQLAMQLRAQGMSDVADHFAFRAQVWQRKAHIRDLFDDWLHPWRWPGDLYRYLGSLFLAVLAGYGYRPRRTLFWYIATVLSFMYGYLLVTHGVPLFGLTEPSGTQPLHWYEALVLSVASFHGRGFFPQGINLGDPVAILAASEAVIGLFIEISFIATFTQRYFAR